MKYLLDTNICIGIINGKEPKLREKLISLSKGDVVICSVVKAELLYGVKKSQLRAKNESRLEVFFSQLPSLPFDDASADQYGSLRALLEQAGITVGSNDLMIAAIAQQHRLTVVTRNEREFGMIPTLKTEIW
ncbi:type II toxin-antitoxin system VapC family toxin [Bdellovibrionota bacterium FG-1]